MCINHDEDEHQALAAYFCIKDTTEKADVLIPSQSHALKATLGDTQ